MIISLKDAAVALAALATLAFLMWAMPEKDQLGRPLVVSCLLGAAFGLVLQRSRFCFWCMARDFFERRDPRGLLGILAALAVGGIGYSLLLGIWVPVPSSGRLPPDAHVGPVSWVLAVGAFAFGLGMAFSGSCISAHFYRLGEGAYGSLIALAGAATGFVGGFLSWNWLYLSAIQGAPVLWLPAYLGHGGALAAQLALLSVLALLLVRYWPEAESPPVKAPENGGQPKLQRLFSARWPAITGGVLVGWIALLAYLRTGPLGVTAELGSLARTAASQTGLLPETLLGLDGFAGCATLVKEMLWSRNGVFVAGLVLASIISARVTGGYAPVRVRLRDVPRLYLGGLLLGWGAMVSLGCTVGVLLSGIMAGAVSGWVFGLFCLTGAYAGWFLKGILPLLR
ncbi:YeeE/YedE family protein [Pannonibacter phragmitetus]|uniref:YeeE/YedE family protein n=1 Tax=Pannonibacter phragmitetus TaxID=121719 RepID=UPI000F03EB4C|nr:YeeE/YedE family protein [Pannonibacter phragmitetus]